MTKKVKPTPGYVAERKYLISKKEMIEKFGRTKLIKAALWSDDWWGTTVKFLPILNLIVLLEEQGIYFSKPHQRTNRYKYVIISKRDFQYIYDNLSQDICGNTLEKESSDSKIFYIKEYK